MLYSILRYSHLAHGEMERVKIIYDSRTYFQYYNVKNKLHRCIQSIYFNRKCLQYNIIPKYAKLKIPNTSPIAKRTQKTASKQRIKDEIRFLYCKKQNLNQQLYKLHLHLADTWSSIWPYIQSTIDWNKSHSFEKLHKTRHETIIVCETAIP
jgi:hypothetical protein